MAENAPAADHLTRVDARTHIEQAFDQAVQDIFGTFDLADLRVVVLEGDDKPPAIAIICDSMGQIDLGWIEKTNVLMHTLRGSVAPVEWRARAYKALCDTLSIALPVFGYGEMIEELAQYYWDGDTDDERARRNMVEGYGYDSDDLILPSHVAAKRPDFMLAENAGPLKNMPKPLRARLKRLHTAHDALKAFGHEANAWYFDFHETCEYAPDYEECATLPPMTLVPNDQFGAELDEVGWRGMETRFLDIAGMCPLTNASAISHWFASLHLGAELLAAAQDLILIDPTGERA
ncbi:MAG: hypothetical protein KGL44_05415 [Sphingomonadales bacterium]|nr:hypothetical protein [Sphingomonadales bacterium]